MKKIVVNGEEYISGQFSNPNRTSIPDCYPKVGYPWSIFGMPAIIIIVNKNGFVAETCTEEEWQSALQKSKMVR